MHLAAVNLKMSLTEAFAASTINAAHSIGRSKTHGSIEVGKVADLLVLDAPRWEHLIYQFAGHEHVIQYVIKRGQIVVEKWKFFLWMHFPTNSHNFQDFFLWSSPSGGSCGSPFKSEGSYAFYRLLDKLHLPLTLSRLLTTVGASPRVISAFTENATLIEVNFLDFLTLVEYFCKKSHSWYYKNPF